MIVMQNAELTRWVTETFVVGLSTKLCVSVILSINLVSMNTTTTTTTTSIVCCAKHTMCFSIYSKAAYFV